MKMSLSLFVEFGPGLSPQFHRFPSMAKLLLVLFGDNKSTNPACICASDLEQVLNGASRFLANAWVVKQFTTHAVAYFYTVHQPLHFHACTNACMKMHSLNWA